MMNTCIVLWDALAETHRDEDILTESLGSKEHGGRVRGMDGFVSQSLYFKTVKGKEKIASSQVVEDDSKSKSYKKGHNHLRSSIRSVNIDLYADEDLGNTPMNEEVKVINFVVTFKILMFIG